jgi:hypothetical protein
MITGHLYAFRKLSQSRNAVLVLQFLRYFKVFCVVEECWHYTALSLLDLGDSGHQRSD